MPPRLAHKKSRAGCGRCKDRKVKCDEVHPACSGCRRHRVPCVYQAASIKSSAPESGTIEAKTSCSGPGSPYAHEPIDSIAAAPRRIIEMFLLHHYTTVTSKTFPGNFVPEINEALTVEGVYTAFEHPFLLDATLAITALHLALVPTNRRSILENVNFAQVHRIYLNLAVQEQREVLSNINKSNADAICVSSMLMNIISVRLLPDQMEMEPYTPPDQWLSMSSALTTVSRATHPFLQGHTILQFLNATKGPDLSDSNQLFDFNYADPLRAILDFNDGLEIVGEETYDVYDHALAFVNKIQRAIEKPELPHQICRRLMALASFTPRKFITLVAERRPRALVIIAHHMALTKYVEHYWWFEKVAERDVHGIQNMLPDKWQWALERPMTLLTRYT